MCQGRSLLRNASSAASRETECSRNKASGRMAPGARSNVSAAAQTRGSRQTNRPRDVPRARERGPLQARIREVELARDAPLKQIEMGLENDFRLHDMEIVDFRSVYTCQDLGEKIGLLLIVALEADLSPGRMTASRSAFALSGGTILPLA